MEKATEIYKSLGFMATVEHEGTPDGATFVKIVLRSTEGDYSVFRRIDHALLKMGWTKHAVKNKYTKTAVGLMRSKILSLRAMYLYSESV